MWTGRNIHAVHLLPPTVRVTRDTTDNELLRSSFYPWPLPSPPNAENGLDRPPHVPWVAFSCDRRLRVVGLSRAVRQRSAVRWIMRRSPVSRTVFVSRRLRGLSPRHSGRGHRRLDCIAFYPRDVWRRPWTVIISPCGFAGSQWLSVLGNQYNVDWPPPVATALSLVTVVSSVIGCS